MLCYNRNDCFDGAEFSECIWNLWHTHSLCGKRDQCMLRRRWGWSCGDWWGFRGLRFVARFWKPFSPRCLIIERDSAGCGWCFEKTSPEIRGRWSGMTASFFSFLSSGLRLTLNKVRSFIGKSQPLSDEALQIYHTLLLPLTTMLILSVPEALLLLKKAGAINQPNVRNLDDLVRLAKTLHSHGPRYILLKGGKLPLTESLEVPNSDSEKQIIVDVYYDGTDISLFKTPYISSEMPLGAGQAFAGMLSIPETIVSQSNNLR